MTNSFGALFLTLLAGLWLFAPAFWIVRSFTKGGALSWPMALMGLLMMVGGEGFFAPSFLVEGVFKPPSTFQWPAGLVRGIATTPDGVNVVPITPAGRVQLYDSRWHFIRGWQVNAGGGDFKVETTPEGIIEVFTARGQHHYSFTEDGVRIPADHGGGGILEDYGSLSAGEFTSVPTPPYLWIFSSPFLSWGVGVIGMAGGMTILRRLTPPKS